MKDAVVIFTTNLEFSKWNGIFYDEIRQPPSLPFSSPQSFTGLSGPSYPLPHSYYESKLTEIRQGAAKINSNAVWCAVCKFILPNTP